MHNRGYYIFEGPDGCGKTTIVKKVKEILSKYYDPDKIIITRAPGYTEFGAKMREIALTYPSIDPLTRQIIYMADTVNYYEAFLKHVPSDTIVLQDRTSYISSVVYGVSDGVPIDSIARFLGIYNPLKADGLIVISTPKEIREQRKKSDKGRTDYFESKPISFHDSVDSMYRSIISDDSLRLITSDIVHLDNVKYIDNIDLDKDAIYVSNIIRSHVDAKGDN